MVFACIVHNALSFCATIYDYRHTVPRHGIHLL